jgi:hypothetical protein
MASLKGFSDHELYIDRSQAFQILRFFFPVTVFRLDQITNEYRSFSQALLIEAIDASYKMGYVVIIANAVLYKSPTGFGQIAVIIKSIAKKSILHWFKHRKPKEKIENAKIYEIVRITITRNFRSVFEASFATGELLY